ncbi:caspase family protein [Streptomyces sp. NPDC047000]|uniref:caspase, EACC1-associated type n=1 Tax=Streptomyces sp. NPDC047000 TaxID=3155474 RepID=UPI0033BFCB7D
MTHKPPSANRSRAVLIASSTFTDAKFTDLHATARTARGLKKQLRDLSVWGISHGHCQVVDAHDCTREELLEIVREASQAAEECFVLYFGGHGVNVKGRLLLPLPHSSASETNTMLEFAELMQAVDAGGASSKLALIDCCHAGLAMGALPFEQHVHGEVPEGCYVIAACEANRTAKAPEDHEFTAFGRALLRCLANDGPPDQEFWTPAQLLARIDGLLTGEGYPQPVTNGSPVGELPWVNNRGYDQFYEPADLSVPAPHNGVRTPEQADRIRYLGPDPLPLPTPFLGREDLLGEVGRRVRAGQVLPVTGGELVGKSALLTALVDRADTLSPLPFPPVVLEIEPSSAAEQPLLEAIARALHQTLDDSDLSVVAERRADSLFGLVLPRQVKGRSLILVVKASRIDLSRPEVVRELDELLKQDVFRRAAVLVETGDPVELDGGRWWPRPVTVPELNTSDALLLIGDWLTDENLVTDVNALELVHDNFARRPGIIERAVRLVARQHREDDFDSFLAGRRTDHGTVQEVAPGEVDNALVNAAIPTVKEALDRAWSTMRSEDTAHARSVLTVWGVVEKLPLSLDVLRALGLPKDTVRVLYHDGVVIPWRPVAGSDSPAEHVPCFEISLVSRAALRKELLDAVGPAGGSGTDRALDELDRRLTTAAQRLGTAVLPDGRSDASSDEVLLQVIESLRRATGWLDRHVPHALAGLRDRLGLYVNSQSAEAPLLPVAQTIETWSAGTSPVPQDSTKEPAASAVGSRTAEDETAADTGAWSWERIDELYATAGRLNLASRASAKEANTGKIFIHLFDHAVRLLEACRGDIPWHILRAVDQCGFHGARRHRVFAEIVPARVRLARQLAAQQDGRADARLNHLLWSVSWTLNTAASQVAASDLDSVGDTIRWAEQLLVMLPPAPDAKARQTRNWLAYRMAGLRRATAMTADERQTAAHTAYSLAKENTLLATDMPERLHQWTRNLLTSAYAYAQEIRDDRERLDLGNATLSTLEDVWGPRNEWGTPLLAEASRFLRRVHARHADSELQYEGARQVLTLLQPPRPDQGMGPAPVMDVEHMAELAEAHAFLAHALLERNEPSAARPKLRQGIQIARQAAKDFPSARTHRIWLRLLRLSEEWFGDGQGRNPSPEHAKAVAEIRSWLDSSQEARYGNHAMALLHLWCLDGDWRREGSLSVALRNQPTRLTWNTGRSPEQTRMDQVNRIRLNALLTHERVYGPTWALYDARIRLSREYQRWSAIYGRHPLEVDHGPVWKLLADAEKKFPRDLSVRRTRASYHRYIWEYGKAAQLYIKSVREETDGDRFRRDMIDASECLLSQSLHQEGLATEERESALRMAADLLRQVTALHSQTHRVSLLSARIALELNSPVDWGMADSTFAEFLGDDYVGNSGPYLDERRQRTADPGKAGGGEEHRPEDEGAREPADALDVFAVDDLVEKHFTDVDALRSLGSLYLRHSILTAERDPEAALAGAWRAYNCFNGRRVMEMVSGHEWVDTAFLRGQTITWAAELTSSASPFPAESGNQHGWLHLAESRLQSARDRSAGGFHQLVCVWSERLRELKARLNER